MKHSFLVCLAIGILAAPFTSMAQDLVESCETDSIRITYLGDGSNASILRSDPIRLPSGFCAYYVEATGKRIEQVVFDISGAGWEASEASVVSDNAL
jgi:hypothetical protein